MTAATQVRTPSCEDMSSVQILLEAGALSELVNLLLRQANPLLWETAAAAAKEDGCADAEHAIWIARRREGIGGSDVATLLGMNSRWTKPQELWEIKTGRRESDPPTPATQRGHDLEPWVVEEAARLTGATIDPAGVAFHRHPRWAQGVCIQANTDGTVAPPEGSTLGPGLFEAKTCKLSTYGDSPSQAFLHDQIPNGYLLQCQAYMAATGMQWGVIAAAIGPSAHDNWTPGNVLGFTCLSFLAHKPIQAMIEIACAEFWECVKRDTPPQWRHHHALPEILRQCAQVRTKVSRTPEGGLARWWRG